MLRNTHLEIVNAEAERLPQPAEEAHNPQMLHEKAEQLAHDLTWLPNHSSMDVVEARTDAMEDALKPIFGMLESAQPKSPISDDYRWLYDNDRLLYSELQNACEALKTHEKLPHVRTAKGEVTPRVLIIAETFLEA